LVDVDVDVFVDAALALASWNANEEENMFPAITRQRLDRVVWIGNKQRVIIASIVLA
jgi:hypothetical protein